MRIKQPHIYFVSKACNVSIKNFGLVQHLPDGWTRSVYNKNPTTILYYNLIVFEYNKNQTTTLYRNLNRLGYNKNIKI